jgi:hypothetical protein
MSAFQIAAGARSPADEDGGRSAAFLSPHILQNGPRRQGSATPRKTSAPLTAPGRSTDSTDMKERPPLKTASKLDAPHVRRRTVPRQGFSPKLITEILSRCAAPDLIGGNSGLYFGLRLAQHFS